MKSEPRPPGVTFAVKCACGFGADSTAETAELAILEMQARHNCTAPTLSTVAYAG